MLFIFIFLGIQAFALGGTLGSIINSILPIAAGGIVIKKDENINEKNENEINSNVEKALKII